MSGSIPLGSFQGQGLDPNSVTFLKSVGYPDEVANQVGGSKMNVTFDKGGEEGQYKIVFEQPEISRRQDVVFRSGEETTMQLPGGKWVKSTFTWDSKSSTLKGDYKNNENIQWVLNFEFDGTDNVRLVRKSASANSLLHFKKSA